MKFGMKNYSDQSINFSEPKMKTMPSNWPTMEAMDWEVQFSVQTMGNNSQIALEVV